MNPKSGGIPPSDKRFNMVENDILDDNWVVMSNLFVVILVIDIIGIISIIEIIE